MPLQGVWTADNGELPPWKGDYHHDLNTELCYSSYAKANHLEEGECLIDYLFQLEDQAKNLPPHILKRPGCACRRDGFTGQSARRVADVCFITHQSALAVPSDQKAFRLFGRSSVLEQKAYPYIKECAKLILALLVRDENGELTLPLSSSPEIHDNTLKACLRPIPIMILPDALPV